jgi:hypothetical protein
MKNKPKTVAVRLLRQDVSRYSDYCFDLESFSAIDVPFSMQECATDMSK